LIHFFILSCKVTKNKRKTMLFVEKMGKSLCFSLFLSNFAAGKEQYNF